MTKIVCDICKKEMSPIAIIAPSDNFPFRIDTNGKRMDVCMECQKALRIWIQQRKAESEEKEKE